MAGVRIAAQFVGEERSMNGLNGIVEELLEDPREEHYIVAKVKVRRITEDIEDGGIRTPTVNLVHIEPLDGKDGETAHRLLQKAYLARQKGEAAASGQDDLFSEKED